MRALAGELDVDRGVDTRKLSAAQQAIAAAAALRELVEAIARIDGLDRITPVPASGVISTAR